MEGIRGRGGGWEGGKSKKRSVEKASLAPSCHPILRRGGIEVDGDVKIEGSRETQMQGGGKLKPAHLSS